ITSSRGVVKNRRLEGKRCSAIARRSRRTRSSQVVNRTLWPASAAARASATDSMVLPAPGGPMKTMLAASSMKRRVARSRMRAWSAPGWAEAGGELAGLGGGGLGAHELVEGVQDGQLPVAGVVEQAGQGLDGGAELEVGEVAAEPLVGGRVVVRGGHAGSPFPVFLVLPGGRGGAAAVPGGRGGGEPADEGAALGALGVQGGF